MSARAKKRPATGSAKPTRTPRPPRVPPSPEPTPAPKPAARNPMTVVRRSEPHDAPTCGARVRTGGACRFVAGFKTNHVGEGRCHLHGGLTPIKHGRYSSITGTRIGPLIEQHEADPDPLNILPELAAARALFQDFVERYDVWRDALVAWHQSYRAASRPLSDERLLALAALLDEYEVLLREQDEPTEKQRGDLEIARETVDALRATADGKPTQILDISDAYRIVSEITKIVQRIEQIRAENAIGRADFLRVMTEMGRVVEAHVRDEAQRTRIRDGWLAIRVA